MKQRKQYKDTPKKHQDSKLRIQVKKLQDMMCILQRNLAKTQVGSPIKKEDKDKKNATCKEACPAREWNLLCFEDKACLKGVAML